MLVAQKTLCGKDNIFHEIFCAHFVTSTFVSSVGRAWDCSEKVCFDNPRSPVQSRHGGFHLFDFSVKCLSFTTHSLCTTDLNYWISVMQIEANGGHLDSHINLHWYY